MGASAVEYGSHFDTERNEDEFSGAEPSVGSGPRPKTRGLRLHMQPAAASRSIRGKEVVYIDHNYVHHHHHFHGLNDWGRPGDIPPESACRMWEAKVAAAVEGTRRPAITPGPASHQWAASPRSIATLACVEPDTMFSAESLVCRDLPSAGSRVDIGSFARRKLPLDDYFSMIARLP